MGTREAEERTVPVAVPGPLALTLEARPRDDVPHNPDDDEPFDWRVTGAVFALLWAAFTSLVMSVAPPTWGGLLAWFVATASLGTEVARQRYLWVRHERRLLAAATAMRATLPAPPTATTSAAETDSAPAGEPGEQGATALDVDGVEPGLDKDPA